MLLFKIANIRKWELLLLITCLSFTIGNTREQHHNEINPNSEMTNPKQKLIYKKYIKEDNRYLTNHDVDTSLQIEYLSSSFWSIFSCPEIIDNYLLLAHTNGIAVVDITDPANPDSIGYFYFEGDTWSMHRRGDYIYATGPGIKIYDISNPMIPNSVATYDSIITYHDIQIYNNLAILFSRSPGSPPGNKLQLYSLDNPVSPVLLGDYIISYDKFLNLSDFAVNDSLVVATFMLFADMGDYYISTDTSLVKIFNIINPDSISEIIEFRICRATYELSVSENRLGYIHQQQSYPHQDELVIMNIENPNTPETLGVYISDYVLYDFIIRDSLAYMATQDGLQVLSLSDPENIYQIGFCSSVGYISRLRMFDTLLVASPDSKVIDISDPTTPHELGRYSSPWHSSKICIQGDYAYRVTQGIDIIDISNIYMPAIINNIPINRTDEILIADSLLLAFGGSYLCVYDISDPYAVDSLGQIEVPYYIECNDMSVSDSIVYINNSERSLIYSIGNPANPDSVGFYETTGYSLGIDARDSLLFIADYYSLLIMNMADPTNPELISSYDLPNKASDVYVDGNYAYVGNLFNGLYIINIQYPAYPYIVDEFDGCGYLLDVKIENKMAYLGSGALYALDITDPWSVSLASYYDVPGSAYDIFVKDTILIVSNNASMIFLKHSFIGGQVTCGNANGDDLVNVGDAVFLINYIFREGPEPSPVCMGDANADGLTNVGDAVHIINYIWREGPPPDENCCS